MDSKFNSPKTKEEFLKRAEKVELEAAETMKFAIRSRIASAIRGYQDELQYYEAVVQLKKEGPDAVEWPKAAK